MFRVVVVATKSNRPQGVLAEVAVAVAVTLAAVTLVVVTLVVVVVAKQS